MDWPEIGGQLLLTLLTTKQTQLCCAVPGHPWYIWPRYCIGWDSIALKGQEISSGPPDADVNSLWCILHDSLIDGTKTFIPHKRSKTKIDLPYLTPPLRGLIHGRGRLHKKIKKLQHNIFNHASTAALKSRYKILNAQVQREIRRVYWTYIEKVIMPLDTRSHLSPSSHLWAEIAWREWAYHPWNHLISATR